MGCFTNTFPMPWPVSMVPFGKRPKTLPTALSRDEIDRLLQCTPNLKHRTFLMVLYSAGLRFSEAASLRIADIEFTNLQNDAAWEAFCESLESVDWVSFIQPPPSEDASADQVVRYLTRYLTGGPISDRRIMAADR